MDTDIQRGEYNVKTETQTQREDNHVEMGPKIRVMQPEAQKHQDLPATPEGGRSKKVSSPETSKKHVPPTP